MPAILRSPGLFWITDVLVSGLISARGGHRAACCCYGSKARSNSLLVEHCSPSWNAFSCAQHSDRT